MFYQSMKKAARLFMVICLVVSTALVFSFIFSSSCIAVTVTLSDVPSTITTEQFTLTASVSGAQAGTNYLKIDLFKDGSQNYFGETNTPQGWYGGSDYAQTFPITIVANTFWSGQIQGKLGTPSMTQYDGLGTYKLRVRRFTSSGSYIASDAFPIGIAVPTQTPTPTNTPTPTDTPTPTRTPTPTKTPSPTPADDEEITPAKISIVSTKKVLSPTAVLGDSTASAAFLEEEVSVTRLISQKTQPVKKASPINFIPFLFIFGGLFVLISCGILVFQPQITELWRKR